MAIRTLPGPMRGAAAVGLSQPALLPGARITHVASAVAAPPRPSTVATSWVNEQHRQQDPGPVLRASPQQQSSTATEPSSRHQPSYSPMPPKPEPPHPISWEREQLDAPEAGLDDWSHEFRDYKDATQQMEDLANMLAEVDLIVVAQPLPVSAPIQSPIQPQEVLATPEARRRKREQSRAARKVAGAGASEAAQPQVQSAVSSAVRQSGASAGLTQVAPSKQHSIVQQQPIHLDAFLTSPVDDGHLPAPSSTLSTKPLRRLATRTAAATTAMQTTQQSVALAPSPTFLAGLPKGLGLRLASKSTVTVASAQGTGASNLLVSHVPALVSTSSVRTQRDSTKRAAASSASVSMVEPKGRGHGDGMTQMMRSVTGHELLQHEQQTELAAVVKDFLGLKKLQHELQCILKRLPTDEEWAGAVGMPTSQFRARLAAGELAKATMLKSNYRLVINVVKKYQGRGMSMQDLTTEGMQGLMRGVEKFDADKGFRFSTYAHWWIRQAVTRALQEQTRAVRLPAHLHEQVTRVLMARDRLTATLGRVPDLDELAYATGIAAEKIPDLMQHTSPAMSLESSAVSDDDGSGELKDTIADERDNPEEMFEESMLRKNLDEVLDSLGKREAGVLRMHWGLDGHAERTLDDIGLHFQVTRERIRQIEVRALRRLKERQHLLMPGVLTELQSMEASVSSDLAGRSSRGTKKT